MIPATLEVKSVRGGGVGGVSRLEPTPVVSHLISTYDRLLTFTPLAILLYRREYTRPTLSNIELAHRPTCIELIDLAWIYLLVLHV